jgi:transglutaminase-like putative cysteine protease
MKLEIEHETLYRYDAPVRSSTQMLRLTPTSGARQNVVEWALETSGAATRTQDGYGNVLDVLTLDRPVSEIRIRAFGVVDTLAAGEAPAGTDPNPLSPLVFLRVTTLTRSDPALRQAAEAARGQAGSLEGLRDLGAALARTLGKQPGTDNDTLTHAFIACCRHLGVPARYVSGYVHVPAAGKDAPGTVGLHAWAEAWAGGRWHSLDIAAGTPAGEQHIQLAIGADALDACPIRGIRTGGGLETMQTRAKARVVKAARQTQRQAQG